MSAKLKTLALAITAAMALTAVVASAASAAPKIESASGSYPITVKLAQEEARKLIVTLKDDTGIATECTTATFEGTLTARTSEPVFHPTYEGCTSFFGLKATVTTTGCDHKLNITETDPAGLGNPDKLVGDVTILCSGTNQTIVHGGTCTVQIGNQANLKDVTAEFFTPTNNVTLKTTLTGMSYTITEDGFLCPLNNGQTTGKEGEMTGNFVSSTGNVKGAME